jgi:hypothetical protein
VPPGRGRWSWRALAGDLLHEDPEQLTFLVLDHPKMIELIPVDVLLYAALDQGAQLARRNGVQLDRRSIAQSVAWLLPLTFVGRVGSCQCLIC